MKSFSSIDTRLVELKTNNLASEYAGLNFNLLVEQVMKMNSFISYHKAEELVGDVILSLLEAEKEGEGYKSNYKGEDISLEQFVFGKLKGYSKNKRYDSRYTEVRGNEENGIYVVASDNLNVSDLDSLDNFQKAYHMAASYDDLESVDDAIDIRELIDYCIGFDSRTGVSFVNLLKHMDVFSNNINKSLFEKFREVAEYHNEFAEAVRAVFEFSMKNKVQFQRVLEMY